MSGLVRRLASVGALLGAAMLGAAMPAKSRPAPVVPLNHLPALAGDYFAIDSRAASHRYHIYVRLPQGYGEDPSRRYPIVYLLDGDTLFPVLGGNHILLTIDDKIPEAIVVGIAYGSYEKPANRRHIDFMPPSPGPDPEPSGTAAFHAFLKDELLPTVERRYRADPERRILFGQSRAGAMILYSAFTDPDLFWARVASNPSWVPGKEIFYGAPAKSARRDLRLIIATGTSEIPDRRQAGRQWLDHIRGRPAPWAVNWIDIPGGTHSANSADAYRAALRALFPDRPR